MNSLENISPAKPSHNEELKAACPTLAGTIGATLADGSAERFSDDDAEFLKFHGIYQGDNRDQRKTGKQYGFLVRARLPGGILRPQQYLALDRLADQFGNHTLRLTSRQSVQLHGVVKSGLGPVMKGLHEALVTTLAACGDVARNVMAPPAPTSRLVEQVQQQARRISEALLPQTPAYHQIWVGDRELRLPSPPSESFVDPLYGPTYLPRKFKVAIAIPPLNDVDVYTHCLGLVAIVEGEDIVGYNLLAGGGMGLTFGNEQTYARLADLVGFVRSEQVDAAVKAVLSVHRDFGDRTNRKHARLKYVIQERGLAWFRSELERRLRFKLEPARPFRFDRQGDLFGWHEQCDGNWFLGLHVEGGRIRDAGQCQLKTALRRAVEEFRPEVRLTPSQNVLLSQVKPEEREKLNQVLAAHGVAVGEPRSAIRRAAMACPALPTCGRALAEAERALPEMVTRLEQLLSEVGLPNEDIALRMTGCPNGCDRPLLGEIGLVGKAPNKYHLYLGGSHASTRLNRLFRPSLNSDGIVQELRPIFQRFARERQDDERFGDFCQRVILSE